MAVDLTIEARDLLAMHLVPGLGPRLTSALLERFGSAAAVRQASSADLAEVPHIGTKLARDFHEALRRIDIGPELELIERHRTHLVPIGSSEYPPALATIGDAPQLLYVRGQFDSRDTNAVAIVGSRHCTSYGKRIAERLAEGLVRANFTVVSGLARGIDGAAHRGALKARGRTIAVLAGGLSNIYPPEHIELSIEIESSGALVTEANMAMQPLAEMFPRRNRIISGLSRGVIIVEAAERSGALITARHAAEQGRSVFAVPGPVDSPASAGVLKLIRDGATLIRRVEDIIEELDGVAPIAAEVKKTAPVQLPPDQQSVWEALGTESRHIDELARTLHMPASTLAALLLTMEMKKCIRRLPGNRFERC
jgi:DNA processing protein